MSNQQICNSTFVQEDVDKNSQISSVAGVKSYCVSPSAPTSEAWLHFPKNHSFLMLGNPFPHRLPGNRSPEGHRPVLWAVRMATSRPHQTALWLTTLHLHSAFLSFLNPNVSGCVQGSRAGTRTGGSKRSNPTSARWCHFQPEAGTPVRLPLMLTDSLTI